MNKIECVKGWEQNLTPGQLYVMVLDVEDYETGETYTEHGSFVYWTGTDLVYEDGDDARGDWDYLVAQDGTQPNPKFIWN